MSRPLRIEYEGAWYHVMNRGRRSDRIFEGRKDYLLFILMGCIRDDSTEEMVLMARCFVDRGSRAPFSGGVRQDT